MTPGIIVQYLFIRSFNALNYNLTKLWLAFKDISMNFLNIHAMYETAIKWAIESRGDLNYRVLNIIH